MRQPDTSLETFDLGKCMLTESIVPGAVEIKNILIATDFSAESENALQYALTLALRYQSKIHLVHVIQPVAHDFLSRARAKLAQEQRRLAAEEQISRQAEEVAFVPHQIHMVEGVTAEMIDIVAKEIAADLVVIGTKGAEGIPKLFQGSTAEEVFRRVSCPVLIFSQHMRRPAPSAELRQVLCPTDLVSDERYALGYAVSVAERHDAKLTLVHVLGGVSPLLKADFLDFEKPYINRMQALIPNEAKLPAGAEFRIEYWEAVSDAVVFTARGLAADLIVLSVHPEESCKPRRRDHAYRIIAHAPCPVLTVRELEKN
jgi:nucleotide-binding universal stress UspA family protein